MDKRIKYILEKYKIGGSTRYTCPNCGSKKSFARYIHIDTQEYVDDTCGKCNHESSCGYHYTPKQFFKDHPNSSKPGEKVNSLLSAIIKVPKKKILCTIPSEHVNAYHSKQSIFFKWLESLGFGAEHLERIFNDYQLGASQDRRVVFWQIDKYQQVRSGKLMRYRTDGHRQGNPNWIHAVLQQAGRLPADWELTQCFFGEHLLLNNTLPVGLVESEKTAILCAIVYPELTWIATGGCKQLNAEKCNVLRGQKVVVFPDSGEYEDWQKILSSTSGFDYTISKDLESYPKNFDIADKIIEELINK